MALDALADYLDCLEAHALEAVDALVTQHRAELFDVVADSADQLPAVATAGAPTDTVSFEQYHRQAALGQLDGRIQAAEATADHTDVSLLLVLQVSKVQVAVGRGGVVGRGVGVGGCSRLQGGHVRALDGWQSSQLPASCGRLQVAAAQHTARRTGFEAPAGPAPEMGASARRQSGTGSSSDSLTSSMTM